MASYEERVEMLKKALTPEDNSDSITMLIAMHLLACETPHAGNMKLWTCMFLWMQTEHIKQNNEQSDNDFAKVILEFYKPSLMPEYQNIETALKAVTKLRVMSTVHSI